MGAFFDKEETIENGGAQKEVVGNTKLGEDAGEKGAAIEFDIMLPLFELRWCTRPVLEGLTQLYSPRSLHVVAPGLTARALEKAAKAWDIAPLFVHEEETYFKGELTRERIVNETTWGTDTLYKPGWIYQQILKLGAAEAIPELSDWYLVWDSDMLPVNSWPVLRATKDGKDVEHCCGLIQDKSRQGWKIVAMWDAWCKAVVGEELRDDEESTFCIHHMWFNRQYLENFHKLISAERERAGDGGNSRHWTLNLMRSAAAYGSFSEYWAYATYLKSINAASGPKGVTFLPYKDYGARAERFFDDGTDAAKFSRSLRERMRKNGKLISKDNFSPSYSDVADFVKRYYKQANDPIPSVLSFEASSRHLKKGKDRMHVEEIRSKWNPALTED